MAWRRNGTGKSGAQSPSTEEILLDLRDPLPPGTLVFGMPTRCPDCEDYGYIDHIDNVARVMKLHCPTCHSRWVITEQQIESATAAQRLFEAIAAPADADAS